MYPTFTLPNELHHGERWLFAHFTLDPIERVAHVDGSYGKERILGDWTFRAEVERDRFLDAHLAHNERAFEWEARHVECAQAEARARERDGNVKRVGYGIE